MNKERLDIKKRFKRAMSYAIIQDGVRVVYLDHDEMREGKRVARERLRNEGLSYTVEYFNGDKKIPISREIVEKNN